MMIIRDTKIAWIVSLTFELIEISFRHWLENFWECWWDQLGLDLFGCNMFGIILGALTIDYFGVSRITWIYTKPKKSIPKCGDSGMVQGAMDKLRPDVLTTYNWKMFENITRYSQVMFYIWFILSVDSLNFFMKYVLWVPAESDILKIRVAIWAFSAIITSKEFFEYLDDPNCKRVGPFFWLSTFTVLIEYGIWFKFSRGMFDAPFPWYVVLIWTVYFSLVIAGGLYALNNGLKSEPSLKKTYNLNDPEITIEQTKAVLAEGNKKRN